MSFGQTLADYVAGISLSKVPQRDIDVAKLAILDQIGVALAGVGEDPGVKVQAMVDRCTASEATVLGNPRKTSTWLAALVNGTLGHTLDFDDCSSFGHPSVVLVPAMLATGETQNRSGRAPASQSGWASSIRRPTWPTILSMIRRRWVSSTKLAVVFSTLPLRSTKTMFGPLTITSVMSSSRSRRSIGP